MEAGGLSDVLFLGGRAGVGKTTVALEASHLLERAEVSHAVIEGDNLDQAYPAPWRGGLALAERNLAAIWANYRAAGYTRLIYTNTVSVLQTEPLIAAIGGEVRATAVLLTATDDTARRRLAMREIGSGLDAHVARSERAARELAAKAEASVHRVSTDGRSVEAIARAVLGLAGWLSGDPR